MSFKRQNVSQEIFSSILKTVKDNYLKDINSSSLLWGKPRKFRISYFSNLPKILCLSIYSYFNLLWRLSSNKNRPIPAFKVHHKNLKMYCTNYNISDPYKIFSKYYSFTQVQRFVLVNLRSHSFDIFFYDLDRFTHLSTYPLLFSLDLSGTTLFSSFFKTFNPTFFLYKSIIFSFYNLFFSLSPISIDFVFEGQLWEKCLVHAAKKSEIQSVVGFLHALNITCLENTRIRFSNGFSPYVLRVLGVRQKEHLIAYHHWPDSLISVSSASSPSSSLLSYITTFSTDYNDRYHAIIVLGSYFKHEDLAAYSFVESLMASFPHLLILYRPHPLRSTKKFQLASQKHQKSISSHSIFPLFILSPLSSTSSIELSLGYSGRLLLYSHPSFHTLNPLFQFFINLQTVSVSRQYLIQRPIFIDDSG